MFKISASVSRTLLWAASKATHNVRQECTQYFDNITPRLLHPMRNGIIISCTLCHCVHRGAHFVRFIAAWITLNQNAIKCSPNVTSFCVRLPANDPIIIGHHHPAAGIAIRTQRIASARIPITHHKRNIRTCVVRILMKHVNDSISPHDTTYVRACALRSAHHIADIVCCELPADMRKHHHRWGCAAPVFRNGK